MKVQYKRVIAVMVCGLMMLNLIACNLNLETLLHQGNAEMQEAQSSVEESALWEDSESLSENAASEEENLQSEEPAEALSEPTEKFRSASDMVSDIRLGWNVGNSLDSYGDWINGASTEDYETAWGNPVITQELIHCVKEQGFNAVRVPVTYLHFMDEEGKIDEVWLARVKEVVDYVLAEEMYCIIDIHHDTGAGDNAWIVADPYLYENGMAQRFAYAWQQIAEYFKDYDDRLIFEGMNEVLDASRNWGGSTPENYEVINQLNQVFVDTVRATGGNNAQRNLVVVAYGNSSHESQISGFVPPHDTAENHLVIGIHVYEPDGFCNGNDVVWDEGDEATLDATFERIYGNVVQKYQLPVIVGEFGARELNESEAYKKERSAFAKYFVEKAHARGIACFWWDDGGSMKIFDRANAVPYDSYTIQAMMEATED